VNVTPLLVETIEWFEPMKHPLFCDDVSQRLSLFRVFRNLQKAEGEKTYYANLLSSTKMQPCNPTDGKNENHNVGYNVDKRAGGDSVCICRLAICKCVDLSIDQETQRGEGPAWQNKEEVEPPESSEPACVHMEYATEQEDHGEFGSRHRNEVQRGTSEVALEYNSQETAFPSDSNVTYIVKRSRERDSFCWTERDEFC
jgi:hypothetical protein